MLQIVRSVRETQRYDEMMNQSRRNAGGRRAEEEATVRNKESEDYHKRQRKSLTVLARRITLSVTPIHILYEYKQTGRGVFVCFL